MDILAFLAGLGALAVAIAALIRANHNRYLIEDHRLYDHDLDQKRAEKPAAGPETAGEPQRQPEPSAPVTAQKPTAPQAQEHETAETPPPLPTEVKTGRDIEQTAIPPYLDQEMKKAQPEEPAKKKPSWNLEELIGTRLMPIVGVILLIFVAGFAVKWAYEQSILSDKLKAAAIVAAGLGAIIAGEITRRRQYDIVAKAVTSLGLALLYTAIFTAYKLYGIIGPMPATIAACIVTAGSLIYAVALKEIVIAAITTLGGYLVPIIVLKGTGLQLPLFSYLVVLTAGTLATSYIRSWISIAIFASLAAYVVPAIVSTGSHQLNPFLVYLLLVSLPAILIAFLRNWLPLAATVLAGALVMPSFLAAGESPSAYFLGYLFLIASALMISCKVKQWPKLAVPVFLGCAALPAITNWQTEVTANMLAYWIVINIFAAYMAWSKGWRKTAQVITLAAFVIPKAASISAPLPETYMLYLLLIAVAGFAIAWSKQWLSISIMTIVAAMAMPILGFDGHAASWQFAGYQCAILTVALACAYSRRWHQLSVAAIIAGFFSFVFTEFAPEQTAIFLTTAIYLAAASLASALLTRRSLMAIIGIIASGLLPIIASLNIPALSLPTVGHAPLFTALLVISVAMIAAAQVKRWRCVTAVAFLMTALNYVCWYFPGDSADMGITITWLGAIFGVFFTASLAGALLNRCKEHLEDTLVILANSGFVFYFLWLELSEEFRVALTLCMIGLAVLHIAGTFIIWRKLPDRRVTVQSGLAVGLLFFAIALPALFEWQGRTPLIALTLQAVILAMIGLRFKNIFTQIAAGIIGAVCLAGSVLLLPMHQSDFTVFVNEDFGTLLIVSLSVYAAHMLYRKSDELSPPANSVLSQSLFSISGIYLAIAIVGEWGVHCVDNLDIASYALFDAPVFLRMIMLALAFVILLFAVRPIAPAGRAVRLISMAASWAGLIIAPMIILGLHRNGFTIFFNYDFASLIAVIAATFVSAWLLYRYGSRASRETKYLGYLALAAVIALLILLTEEIYLYFYCRDQYVEAMPTWKFLAHMYVSILWAVYAAILLGIGFWKNMRTIRYLAIGIFALLTAKIFLFDTRQLATGYRIMGFLVTGSILIGASYLYQYLKKKGFFETFKEQNAEQDKRTSADAEE
ncbi:putative membrane protein [Anaerohalosphaera lusitana]|uniref:Putative membrane protein n=1 Tax=Anaerohalosphaera lusitana TaxID=1936003 RepID=A0A1U9NKK9_9BACT|nr:DUF2339 domain-containing protein [Anaerohalosphaera lusitana]AQT68345.1 putative membrane protein [Anaerohalosphaera lusitana]